MSKYREADKGPVPERRSQNHKPTVDVLFLDDSAEFSAIAVNVLRDKGFSVTKESNPKIALGKLVSKEWRPKVIVSDVHMPQMTGVELLRELREQGVIGPVVMLTSDENPELEVELAGLGCDAFIRKQQKPEVLLAWVKNLMERRGYVVKERRRQRNVRNRQERREEAKRPAVQQSSVV
jgi:DNA-binding response OmpR family regulator